MCNVDSINYHSKSITIPDIPRPAWLLLPDGLNTLMCKGANQTQDLPLKFK